MAGFTIVLAGLAAAQWCTANRQAATTRLQLQSQQVELRPYVSFSINLNADHDPIPDADYILIFNCSNNGKTPAFEIGFVGTIWRVAFPLEKANFPEVTGPFVDSRTNLFAEEKMHERNLGFEPNTEIKFTSDQIAEVRAGNFAFVVGLKIRYLDAFNVWHETHEYWTIGYKNGKRFVSLIPGKSVMT